LQEWEQSWAEPLHEYAQFADIIKKLLTYRHQKHVQYEMTKYTLETKREQLDDLERSEAEAQRLQSALSGAARPTSGTVRPPGGKSVLSGEINEEDEIPSAPTAPTPRVYSSQTLPPRRKQSNVGLFGALSYSLHGLMDVDPETARRSQLSKTKESISQVRSFWRFSLVG
jgi:sorting nexin-41/42